ncbi:MAG: pantoate--beta-alanine ligase [Victivallales bacterium]|nr:pantoate--beta-alanine ligase [Victivallales bacterium]
MEIIKKISEMQSFSRQARLAGKRIGVVPTMGFLHAGHTSLIDRARAEGDIVIVTLFVNPVQFAPNEDLETYPRNFAGDCRICETHGVDVLFIPEPEEMYYPDRSVWVSEEKLAAKLCGVSRPYFFRGVCTVVTKLFNITQPDFAVFGQKDAQQALIVKRLVRDLNFPIEIIIGPLVRDRDGLALSSRNRYLNDDERCRARSISRALRQVENDFVKLPIHDTRQITAAIAAKITAAGGEIDYVSIYDADTLEDVSEKSGKVLIACAATFGKARLIDNVVLDLND